MDTLLLVALAVLVVAALIFLVRIVVGPSLPDRVVAVDGMVTTMVAAILVQSIRTSTTLYLDTAVVVAFIGFVGTSAAARLVERKGS